MVVLFAGLSLSLLLLPRWAGGRALRATIEVSGRETMTLDLAEEGVREVSGPLGPTWVQTRGGRVRVLSSPCPLKLCQRAGWVEHAGEMVVCIPNEVVIRLGGRRADVDALSR